VGHPVTQHSLTGNFRSVPPIVRFSRRVIDAGEELRSVRVIEQPRTDQGVHLVECDRRDHEGTFIVHTIVRQREADPALRWSDVAILAANSSAFPSVVHALRQASIPYEFVGRSDILHLSQARDVLAYARLVDEPTDRLALARVLRQPPLALSHASIRQLLHHHVTAGGVSPLIHSRDLPEPARQRVEDLRQWLDEVRRQDRFDGVRWVLRQILDYTGIESAVATARVADSDLVRSALQRLLDVAQEIDEAGEPLTTFLQYLDVLVARDEDPGESEPSGEDTVKVLTIHAAKGLEWPVVFIADATRLPRSPREAVVRLSREPATLAWESLGTGHWNDANRLALDLDAMTLFSAAPAADHEQEERRLAYVGVTRAADVLYLTVPAGQAARSSLSATGTRILEYMKQTRQWRVTKNSATARSYFGSWLSAQLLDTSLARFWKASETLAYTNAPPASLQQRIDQHRYLAGLLALIDSDQPVSFSPTVLARAAELAAQAPQVRSGGTSS
jgi:superfamily I DNA/RNA helicase